MGEVEVQILNKARAFGVRGRPTLSAPAWQQVSVVVTVTVALYLPTRRSELLRALSPVIEDALWTAVGKCRAGLRRISICTD
jgi:hypothetical protein